MKRIFMYSILILIGIFSIESVYAASAMSLGSMASHITKSFTQITKLITGGAYLGGFAFAVSAIMKFKQHKDNPTQISVGQPIALVFIAAALLFLPTVLHIAGQTIFDTTTTVGPTGGTFTSA